MLQTPPAAEDVDHEPADQMARVPDGRQIELPDPPGRRWTPRGIALVAGAVVWLTIVGWMSLDAVQGPAEREARSGAAHDAPRPFSAREKITPAQAVARTPKGMSLVAHGTARGIGLYDSPAATRARRFLRNRNAAGVQTVFLVKGASGTRFKVALPIRPNGSTAWVRAADVRATLVRHRINVDLTRRQLTIWRDDTLIERVPIGVGKAVTPTPTGIYYITALLKQPDPDGIYGPYAFALSGHSPVLNEFAGGNGRIGIHGTNEPWAIGSDVSHGCIRVNNAVVRRFARLLALGTPVRISRS